MTILLASSVFVFLRETCYAKTVQTAPFEDLCSTCIVCMLPAQLLVLQQLRCEEGLTGRTQDEHAGKTSPCWK